METKQDIIDQIREFRAKNSLNYTEENVVTTMHLMNTHLIDIDSALDQTSFGGKDNGIDGWHYEKRTNELFIYQSKLTNNLGGVIAGLKDLQRACKWIEKPILNGEIEKFPENKALGNLLQSLSQNKDHMKKIHLHLLSPYHENDIIDKKEFDLVEDAIARSALFLTLREQGVKVILKVCEYNLEKGIAPIKKNYEIKKLTDSTILLRDDAQLDLAYVPLYNLVELYRQRGDLLFHKNVRLSLMGYKDARNMVVNPMEQTLRQICKGELKPEIFPFYHVGVTIAASENKAEEKAILQLQSPFVINGCQTITIADHFLKELEKKKKYEYIENFKKINVIAKVVIGTTDDELREITISNNRQNPIENWQLYSNDPIHLEIEDCLRDTGIFYERQKGKFDSEMKHLDNLKIYPHTNNTYIKVVDLGQIISLYKERLPFAAKPSDIFINKNNHDSIFSNDITDYPRDMVLIYNLAKAAGSSINYYIKNKPAFEAEEVSSIFRKPIVRTHLLWITILYYYQKKVTNLDYADRLLKIASTNLVSEFDAFLPKIMTKAKKYLMEESKKSKEFSGKKLMDFCGQLCKQNGINLTRGPIPFSKKGINWRDLEPVDKSEQL